MRAEKRSPALGVVSLAAGRIVSSGQRLDPRSSADIAGLQASRGSNHQRELALFFVRAGIPVHPACPRTKRPLTPHGFKDATTDEAQVLALWSEWPDALVSIPTGSATGLWVLDIDVPAGVACLPDLLAVLGVAVLADLSPVVVQTPSGGFHVWFRLRPGECPRSRASDIAPGLDTKGEGGSIIAPGNRLPDGREYRFIGPSTDLADASTTPEELIYLATFNARERFEIASNPDLSAAIRDAAPSAWSGILEAHRRQRAESVKARNVAAAPDPDGMRSQALADIADAADGFAALADGRREQMFVTACRVGKYVAHEIVTEAEFREAFMAAAAANGALSKHGRGWAESTLSNALRASRNDDLPPLAQRFRSNGGGA